MLLSEAISAFLSHMEAIDRSPMTIMGHSVVLNLFQKYIESVFNGPAYVEEITVADIEKYMLSLKTERRNCPGTRSMKLMAIRSLYKFLVKKVVVTHNVAIEVDVVKVPQKERCYLSEAEVETLANSIRHPLVKLIVRFLYFTGLRVRECVSLTLSDVDLENKSVNVRFGKGRKQRRIPLSDKIVPLLLDYKNNWRPYTKNDAFFASKLTGKISPCTINSVLFKAAKDLGWEKPASCHILRHSFASRLVKKNVNIVQIQQLLGHSNLAITSRYTHVNTEQLEQAINEI